MSKEPNKAGSVRQTHALHLRDHEVAAEYLCAALDDGGPGVILMALRNVAEAQVDGISGLASRSNLGRESMYKMLSKTGNPKLSSFTKVIQALGLKLKVEQDVHYKASWVGVIQKPRHKGRDTHTSAAFVLFRVVINTYETANIHSAYRNMHQNWPKSPHWNTFAFIVHVITISLFFYLNCMYGD